MCAQQLPRCRILPHNYETTRWISTRSAGTAAPHCTFLTRAGPQPLPALIRPSRFVALAIVVKASAAIVSAPCAADESARVAALWDHIPVTTSPGSFTSCANHPIETQGKHCTHVSVPCAAGNPRRRVCPGIRRPPAYHPSCCHSRRRCHCHRHCHRAAALHGRRTTPQSVAAAAVAAADA